MAFGQSQDRRKVDEALERIRKKEQEEANERARRALNQGR